MSFISMFLKLTKIQWLVAALVLTTVLVGPYHATTAHAAATDDVVPAVSQGPSAQESGSDPEAYLPYLFAVYAITWGAFFGYIFIMSRKQREMRREIDVLKQALAEREGSRG